MDNTHPIHTEADYKATLQAVSALMESDPDPGSPESDRLDILVAQVQAYEAKHVPNPAPEPAEAIKSLDLRAQEEARALRGKISWDGDLNAARTDK